MKLGGEILFWLINTFADKWDHKAWLKQYARRLMTKFLDKIDIDDLDDEIQDEFLDPIKKWAEKKWKINL